MKRTNRIVLSVAAIFLFLVSGAMAVVSPTKQAQMTADRIMELLNDKSLAASDRDKKIEDIIRSRFDFDVMSQWILGPNWRMASPAERERFKELYMQLLEATYKGRIGEYADQYTNERVEYGAEKIIEDRAMIDTFVVTNDRKIPISYKMILKGDEWKVYDVVIEEVSLVRNFRNTYAEIIRKEGLTGLFARMEKKISDLKAGKTIDADLASPENNAQRENGK